MTRRASNVIAIYLLVGVPDPLAAHAQVSAVYSDSVGFKDIVGLVIGKGNHTACKMQKILADGSIFAYTTKIGTGGNKLDVKTVFCCEDWVSGGHFSECLPLISIVKNGCSSSVA